MAAILITDEKNLKSFYEGVFTSPETLERKFVQDFRKASLTYRIVDIGTSVRFKVEGSKDGSTYTDLFDSTETSNGSFSSGELDISSFTHIRGKIEAITGGTPSIVVHTVIERFINPNVQIGGDDFSSEIEDALNNATNPSASNPFGTQADIAAGAGDMTKAVFDPTAVNGDAFDMENMAEGATNKILSSAERTKLTGITPGATANSSDATLLARANHTGSQLAATISDFAATVIAALLTGISFASSATITATDSILSALGKLQAQVTLNNAKVSADGSVASHSDVTAGQATAIGNLSGVNSGDEPTADETTQGIVERATDAEAATGTDTTRYITPKQLADNSGLATKSGVEPAVSFTGNPKKATITFAGAFADANYSIAVMTQGGDNYTESVESVAAGSFVINLNSNGAPSNPVLWTAIKHGES